MPQTDQITTNDRSQLTSAPISELPSNISTIVSNCVLLTTSPPALPRFYGG